MKWKVNYLPSRRHRKPRMRIEEYDASDDWDATVMAIHNSTPPEIILHAFPIGGYDG